MEEKDINRRRHRRVDTAIPVRISTLDPERDRWTGRPFFRASQETCANVSRGGAFVRTREPLSPGRRVLLEISMPGGPHIEAIGRVAWSKSVLAPRSFATGPVDDEVGVGVEFLGGAPEQLSALDRFIDEAEDSH